MKFFVSSIKIILNIRHFSATKEDLGTWEANEILLTVLFNYYYTIISTKTYDINT